jgi:hypothetical protein
MCPEGNISFRVKHFRGWSDVHSGLASGKMVTAMSMDLMNMAGAYTCVRMRIESMPGVTMATTVNTPAATCGMEEEMDGKNRCPQSIIFVV